MDILSLMAAGKSFALYRYPYDETVHLCMQCDGGLMRLSDLDEVHDNVFVFAPFATTADCPIIALKAEVQQEVQLCAEGGVFVFSQFSEETEKQQYAKVFDRFKQKLESGELQKLVLSRNSRRKVSGSFSVLEVFGKAVERYENSFVYLFHSPEIGSWCGSTMEELLSGTNGKYRTMSVAGTRKNADFSASWDSKNIYEQALVSDFIRGVLKFNNIKFEESAPYTAKAGNLQHLRTDFSFSTNGHPGRLVRALHPTPAVCGIPQQEAMRFILQNEGYNREYYAGYLGMISSDCCRLYVNLRCLKSEDNALLLYAGGGILQESVLESEWNETKEKMETMKSLIII